MLNTPRRLIPCLVVLLTTFAAVAQAPPKGPPAANAGAIQRPTDKVQGWKAVPDPSDFKGKLRGDIKISIPVKHTVQAADSTRPGALVALCDANPFGPRQWGVLNLQTGAFAPAFTDPTHFEDPQLSPDGALLVGKVTPKQLRTPGLEIWNFKTGKPLHRLAGKDAFTVPQAIGFAPGDLLITVTSKHFDGTLAATSTKTGAPAWEAKLPAAVETKNAAISPGGKYVAAVYDKGLWLYDTATGQELSNHALPEPPEPATFGSKPMGMAFSADGQELAAVFEHGMGKSRLVVWDMATGVAIVDRVADALKDERWSKRGERKLEFFPGGQLLRFSNQVIDRDTGKVVHTLAGDAAGGRGIELMKVVAEDKVLAIGERGTDGRAAVTTVSLPKDQIAKAQDVVRAGGRSSDASLPPLSKPDFSGVRTVLEAPAPEPYSLKPDSPATRTNVGLGAIALRPQRPPSGVEHNPTRVIFTGPPANQVAVAYHLGGAFEKDPAKHKTIVDRINLSGGTTSASLEIPGHAAVLDFSADGKLVLVRQGEDRIDLYSLATTPAKHVIGFRPFTGDKNGEKVGWGGIVSPEQFLTISNAGRSILWNASGAKAVYEIALSAGDPQWGGGFTFSPNRKYLAYGNGQGVTLLDPTLGQPVAQLHGPKSSGDHLAFSFDGTRLAHFTYRPYPNLRTYDLNTGKLIGDAALPKETWTGPVVWAAPGYVLVNGYLADLDKKIAVWRYFTGGIAPPIQGAPDGRVWAFVHGQLNQPPAVVAFNLPHDDAKKVIASIRAEENIVLKPGMKISVEAGVEGKPEYQAKVLETLKQRCKDAGLIVEENPQPVRLVASTSNTGSKTLDYDIRGRGRETVTVPEYDCRIQIIKDGQTIWEVSSKAGGSASFIVLLKQDETAQSQVNKANENPGSGFFLNATIPGTVAKPIEKLGTSRFTLRGVQNAAGEQ
jgi:WD40 repeat protein